MQLTMHANSQPEGHGYTGNRRSPMALTATIAVHVAVAGAIILMPAQTYKIIEDIGLPTRNIPLTEDPPVDPSPPQRDPVKTDPKTVVPDPKVDLGATRDTPDILFADSDAGDVIRFDPPTRVDPPPLRLPTLVQARPDPRYAGNFQPQYPGAMIRAEMEGFVKLRVHIDERGRVSAAELIEATDPSFWEAARKQALRYWRFRPATRDGAPVPSNQVMTVRFRLSDL
ncbi:MAG: TonB family protein [Sphingobium sp.]